MSRQTSANFELRKLTDTEWLILDLGLHENDPDRTVACVYRLADVEYDVVWLRDLALPVAYMSPMDVLDDVIRQYRHVPRQRTHAPAANGREVEALPA